MGILSLLKVKVFHLCVSILVFLILSLSLTGCNDDNVKAQDVPEAELDFLIDVISGAVLENPEGDGFILELEVSPITVFIVERPSNNSGTMTTEFFLEEFDEIFSDVPPNAILTHRAEDGIAVAVAVKLNSVVFDASESVAEFLATPLDEITDLNPPGTSLALTSLSDIPTPFGMASLFVDSVSLPPVDLPGADPPPVQCNIDWILACPDVEYCRTFFDCVDSCLRSIRPPCQPL
jgi:hypothetical protein